MTDIIIYTDGACSGNPGAGGWGVVVINNSDIEKFNAAVSYTHLRAHET